MLYRLVIFKRSLSNIVVFDARDTVKLPRYKSTRQSTLRTIYILHTKRTNVMVILRLLLNRVDGRSRYVTDITKTSKYHFTIIFIIGIALHHNLLKQNQQNTRNLLYIYATNKLVR